VGQGAVREVGRGCNDKDLQAGGLGNRLPDRPAVTNRWTVTNKRCCCCYAYPNTSRFSTSPQATRVCHTIVPVGSPPAGVGTKVYGARTS